MAEKLIHSWEIMKFLSGLIFGILLMVALALVAVETGYFNMAASTPPGRVEEYWGTKLYVNSMEKRAPDVRNPLADDASVLASGLSHYKENCVVCHGAPGGVEPSELGKGLNPPAPLLDIPLVQNMSDGQLFWTIQHGIRMTGMPAFGPTHSEEEIWKIVAFVRHLPKLTTQEREVLREATHEAGHHHEEEKEEKPAETPEPKKEHEHDHNHGHQSGIH